MDIRKYFMTISNKANDPKTEQNVRKASLSYENQWCLYLITQENKKTKLAIYDTISEKESVRILDTPEPLDSWTCITQLPNGELFCFGKFPPTGTALIIDSNYKIRALPRGKPSYCSSGIYFDNNIYCFGGRDKNFTYLAASSKFDLNKNRWIDLTSMPQADWLCHSVTFNGNILISGYENRNLLLYSIGIDSFSVIPYKFGKEKRKILINAGELYLIECRYGFIYESQDEYNWKQISESIISYWCPSQVYCLYNQEEIYISISSDNIYYKFDLTQKVIIKL